MPVRRIVAMASIIGYPRKRRRDDTRFAERERPVRYVRAFFAFWYAFLIGDDWRIAAGVVATLLLAAFVAHALNSALAAGVAVLGVLVTCGVALARSMWSRSG
jgi:hypothetical protein